MNYMETEFLKTQSIKQWVWKCFIDNIFFAWMDSKENLERFLWSNSHIPKKNFFCFNDGTSKMIKNAFFHLKSSFRSQDI